MHQTHTLDRTREMRLTFGIEAIPTILLIHPTGKIVYRKVDQVVPILQSKGLLRTHYEGETFRQNLGFDYFNGVRQYDHTHQPYQTELLLCSYP